MTNHTQEKKPRQANQPWYVEQLIAGLDAPPQIKLLLFLVRLHQNTKTGRAWTSQKALAWEMGVAQSTAKRTFSEARVLGLVTVERVRKGKGQKEQFNRYWLNVERLQACQRRDRDTPNRTDQGSPVPLAKDTHQGSQANPATTTDQGSIQNDQGSNDARPGLTSELEGFEVKQVVSKAGRESASGLGERKPFSQDHAGLSGKHAAPSALASSQTKPTLTPRQIKLFWANLPVGWNKVSVAGHLHGAYNVRGLRSLTPIEFAELCRFLKTSTRPTVH